MVHFGFLFWGLDQGAAALRHARDVIASMPPDVNVVVGGLNAPPAPFVPEEHQLQPGYAMIVVGFGSPEQHAAVLDQARSGRTAARRLRLADAVRRAAEDARRGERLGLLLPTTRAATSRSSRTASSTPSSSTSPRRPPRSRSPSSTASTPPTAHAAEDATAFSGGRSPSFGVFIIGVCPAPEMLSGGAGLGPLHRRGPAPVRRQRRLLRQRILRVRRPRPGGRRRTARPSSPVSSSSSRSTTRPTCSTATRGWRRSADPGHVAGAQRSL